MIVIKLLGSLCILAGGFGVRWLQIQSDRCILETLADLTAGLEQLREEIRLTHTALPVLLDRLGQGRSEIAAEFFSSAAQAIRQGQTVETAWRQTAMELPLSMEDRAALAEVGNSLRGDEERVCKGLTLAASRLSVTLEEMRRTRGEREKRTTALCLSAAALLVILLI